MKKIELIKKLSKYFFLISLFISICYFVSIYVIEPYNLEKENEKIVNIFYNTDEKVNKLSEFSKINSDILGWIKIDDTKIDYPILKSTKESPNFYLKHNYKKKPSKYGSIVLDYMCKQELNSKNVILHGHNMKNGEMFGNVLKFCDLEFYKKSPIIKLDNFRNEEKYKIFAVFKTNTLSSQGTIFNYQKAMFSNKNEFLEFVNKVKIRSILDIPVDVEENDQLLMLSTCSYEFEKFRTVLVARKLRNGEDSTVDVNSAKKNNNPKMPQCWYSSAP